MVHCVAYRCTHSSKTKTHGITFHRFPKDEELRKKWTNAVKRKGWEPSKWSALCSAHFRETYMDRTSMSCVRLKEEAVPTIFPVISEATERRPRKRNIGGDSCQAQYGNSVKKHSHPPDDHKKKVFKKRKIRDLVSSTEDKPKQVLGSALGSCTNVKKGLVQVDTIKRNIKRQKQKGQLEESQNEQSNEGGGESGDFHPSSPLECHIAAEEEALGKNVLEPVAFVPVGIPIKDEPLESEDVEDHSDQIDAFFETLDTKPSIPELERCLSAHAPCPAPTTTQDEYTATETIKERVPAAPMLSDQHCRESVSAIINPETHSDFNNLRSVVDKLELISDKLAAVAFGDRYEQFAKYLATLLRGLPHKKFLLMKKKLVTEVICALGDHGSIMSESTDPFRKENAPKAKVTPDIFSYGSTENPDYYSGTIVQLKPSSTCQTDPLFGKSSSSGVGLMIPTEIQDSLGNKTLLVSSPPSSAGWVTPGRAITLSKPGKKPKKTKVPRKKSLHDKGRGAVPQYVMEDQLGDSRFCEDTFQMDVEEGMELNDVKPKGLFEPSFTISKDPEQQEVNKTMKPPDGIKAESFSSVSPTSTDDSDAQLFHCDQCSTYCSTKINLKRHYMITHPGYTPVKNNPPDEDNMNSKKKCSENSLNISSLLQSSAAIPKEN